MPTKSKGKTGVLIEEHFDQTEQREFNSYFPAHGMKLNVFRICGEIISQLVTVVEMLMRSH